jgi:hypothetical protein
MSHRALHTPPPAQGRPCRLAHSWLVSCDGVRPDTEGVRCRCGRPARELERERGTMAVLVDGAAAAGAGAAAAAEEDAAEERVVSIASGTRFIPMG